MRSLKLRHGFLLGVAGACFSWSLSHAFVIPTVDAGAIAEGVKSNIELVKQSAVIAQATSITGEINSAIGSAKSSISELGLEDAKKVAEKIKKEKENLEKAKEEYDKYKEQYDAAKKKLEEGKAEYEKYKSEAQNAVSEVKGVYSEAQGAISEVKNEASGAINDINQAKNQITGSSAQSSTRQTFGSSQSQTTAPVQTQPQAQSQTQVQTRTQQTSQPDNSAELAAAQAEIIKLRQQLAQAQTNNNEQPAVAPNDTTPERLEEALEEVSRLKAELAEYEKMVGSLPDEETKEETTSAPSAGFRKSPTVNINTEFQRQSSLKTDSLYQTTSVFKSETLSFAQASDSETSSNDETSLLDLSNVPTGTNAATDEFIVSDELAQYCGFNVNNTDAATLKSCLEDLIAHRSDSNAQTAAEGNAKYTSIMRDSVVSLASEAIVTKNTASNYQDEVLSKLTEDLGSASTVRDDIAALAQTNNQIQILLNNILKIYASQLYLNSMERIAKYNSRMINPEAEAVIKPSDKDGTTAESSDEI